jgi:hypothetical protein
MPSLNGKAILERERDQSQSHHNPHILINCPDIYRHAASPLKSLASIACIAAPSFDLAQQWICRTNIRKALGGFVITPGSCTGYNLAPVAHCAQGASGYINEPAEYQD